MPTIYNVFHKEKFLGYTADPSVLPGTWTARLAAYDQYCDDPLFHKFLLGWITYSVKSENVNFYRNLAKEMFFKQEEKQDEDL
jgi:hypothetical protein